MSDAEATGRIGGRLISFLGTGDYQPVRYVLDGETADETRWIACALSQLLVPAEIVLIVTSKSAERAPQLIETLMKQGVPEPSLEEVSSAGDFAAQWRLFETLKRLLRDTSGRPLFLDITHGFRSQPFFAAAVVAFVRAVDPAPPPLRVLYGAFEGKDATNVAPVWDLTAFVDLLDWAREIMLFLKTGRAADVADRTGSLDRILSRSWIQAGKDPNHRPRLDRFAKALTAFGNDLETIRTGSLLLGEKVGEGSAARLAATVEEARAAVSAQAPPLADVLDRIAQMVAPLARCDAYLNNAAGHAALAALAQLYFCMGRYSEAATTVREGTITLYANADAACPGTREFSKKSREEAEAVWNRQDDDRSIADIRNDIDHAGFRKRPLAAAKLKERVGHLVSHFENAKAKPEPRPAGCRAFVNLSNHPSDRWPVEQRRQALRLADQIIDVPFPAVPPDVVNLDKLVRETLAQVPAAATHAMVQGEFTLSFAIVRELQRRHIVCYAATGRRDVMEAGDTVSVRRFDFVSFREFPRLD